MTRNAMTIARLFLCVAFCVQSASAEIMLERPTDQVVQQAQALFRDLPKV